MVYRISDLINIHEVKNMDILNVKIKGFRNVSETKVYFNNITALVGLNGYGKSNIMNAIDFGLDFIKRPSQVKAQMMNSKQDIPLLLSNAGQNFEFQIEFGSFLREKKYNVLYGYEFSWGKTNSQARIISEYLKIKTTDKKQKYNALIKRFNNSANYKKTETGRCDVKIKIDDDLLLINKLTAYDDLYYIDIVNQINQIQFFIERHLDASTAYDDLYLGGIQNIPRAIFYLKKNYPSKFNILENSFMQLFPRISKIDVDEIKLNDSNGKKPELPEESMLIFTDNIYTMYVTDKLMAQPLSFESLSDGAKRIFLMLTYATIADLKGLSMIAIEEPENSIHPNLLQSFLDILSQLVDNCKIVFTSHSPYIVQYIDPRNIYIALTTQNGSSDFRRIASTKVNALLRDAVQYDKSVGDYIFNILSSADAEESLNAYVESAE